MAAALAQNQAGTYTFSSQPRALPNKKKYKNEEDDAERSNGFNLMFDRRVVRGSTYALRTIPAAAQPDPIELQRQQEARRRALARKRAQEQLRPKTPDALQGRQHIDVQTELYLEELCDRVEEVDVDCQTDAFLDRPPTPLFVPAKTGIDTSTQILPNELFDFDLEVRPIVQVIGGKTLEQALIEVCEEEELAALRAQQRAFEELRNAEEVEKQRLEEQERRHREEKQRRMEQQRAVLLKEKETAKKVAAHTFAQRYLSDLVPSVYGTLYEQGFFYDAVEREVETQFIPWLSEKVEEEVSREILSRYLLDTLLRDVAESREQAAANRGQK